MQRRGGGGGRTILLEEALEYIREGNGRKEREMEQALCCARSTRGIFGRNGARLLVSPHCRSKFCRDAGGCDNRVSYRVRRRSPWAMKGSNASVLTCHFGCVFLFGLGKVAGGWTNQNGNERDTL